MYILQIIKLIIISNFIIIFNIKLAKKFGLRLKILNLTNFLENNIINSINLIKLIFKKNIEYYLNIF